MDRPLRTLAVNASVTIGALVVLFVVLEVGLRSYDAVRGHGFFSANRSLIARGVHVNTPFRLFGYDLYEEAEGTRWIRSRHGERFPFQKPPRTFRIVTFGGSTTENLRAFQTAGVHYPAVLGAMLASQLPERSLEVINVGFSAYSTAHSLILLQLDVVSWEPDLIIVSHNINDLFAEYWPGFELDYSNKYGSEYYMPSFGTLYTTPNVLFQHSEAYWLLRNRVLRLRRTRRPDPVQRVSRGPLPSEAMRSTFYRNLRHMVTLARSHGIEVVLGSQPIRSDEAHFTEHMALKPYNHLVVYPLHDELLAHHDAMNATLAQVAADEGVHFVDAKAGVADVDANFIDFVHYTPQGIRALAQTYAEHLVEYDVVD